MLKNRSISLCFFACKVTNKFRIYKLFLAKVLWLPFFCPPLYRRLASPLVGERTVLVKVETIMKGDITAELLLLKTLEGAAFGSKLKEIAARKEFRALPGEPFIYTVGGIRDNDFPSLLMAARKAVEHGHFQTLCPVCPVLYGLQKVV